MGKIMSLAKAGLQLVKPGGFSRLKGIFRKGINYQSYQQIVGSAKNKITGNLPEDLLQLIIKKNPADKGGSIKTAQKAFENAAAFLSETEQIQRQAINRFQISLGNVCKVIKDFENPKIVQDKIFKEKMAKVLSSAETEIMQKLKPLLPEIENIKLFYIGGGAFSNAFKCRILDANKRELVSDIVTKSYKSGTSDTQLIMKKLETMFGKYSDKEILSYAKVNGLKITAEDVKLARAKVREILKSLPAVPSSEYKNFLNSMHGAAAEANSAEYIRYMSGHKLKSSDGLLLPTMYSLGAKPFSISTYIGENQKAVRRFEFDRLGLEHSDLLENPNNLINGICVDIGGICGKPDMKKLYTSVKSDESAYKVMRSASESNIIGNKEATRILKRVQSLKSTAAIDNYIKSLENYAKTCKNELQKKTIMQAINEIRTKRLYPPQYGEYEIMPEEITHVAMVPESVLKALDDII